MRSLRPLVLILPLVTIAPIASAQSTPAPKTAAKKKASEPALPPAPARLWMIGPSSKEPWTLRIDNIGLLPMRVPADVRLLTFEIDTHEKGKKPVRCAAPPGLRPETFPDKRGLLLAPGESYIERFDVHLFCFGKHADALAGGDVVSPHFGWDPPKNGKAKIEPPFAAQGTAFPPTNDPLKELLAPTMILAYGPPPAAAADPPPEVVEAKSSAPAEASEPADPPPIVDENAPRLEVTSDPYSDAAAPRDIRIGVTVKNVGHRPLLVAIQPRNFAFKVSGPDGRSVCDHFPTTHAVPRDFFRKLKPNDSASFSVMLNEQCPRLDFGRAGLYTVLPILHAVETGSELGLSAWTGVARGKAPTLLRLATSRLPFYKSPPQAVPTPKPQADADADTDTADAK